MVQGCTSWAGKSLLTTVLCRWLSDLGVDVAPFKAQNMANNARVVADGEIGVAQWLQARAARVVPHVDHNPILLKPEADTRSQVVVHGRVRPDLATMPWKSRGPHLRPAIESSLARLRDAHDVVVIEGAGSPAEINLPDVVNRGVARWADAAVLLVADIDRGGAFAHLFGTWALLDDRDRDRIAGFVLNRFRGDPTLLAPGPELLEERTGVPTLGVVPMVAHGLPDEDGARHWPAPSGRGPRPRVAVVRAPAASNLDEFAAVAAVADVVWATRPADLVGADLVVLPGSKHVVADRRWLADTGVDAALVAAAHAGVPVLGICGGAMLLGHRVEDPEGVEGGRAGAVDGLGLLDLATTMATDKFVAPTQVTAGVGRLAGTPWEHLPAALGGVGTAAYEIRHGRVVATGARATPVLVGTTSPGRAPTAPPRGHEARPPGPAPTASVDDAVVGWADDNVLATTVHGLLESPDVVAALLGTPAPPSLDEVIDELVAQVVGHLDTDRIRALVGA